MSILSNDRLAVRCEIELIAPLDDEEDRCKQDVLAWIDSGVEICRQRKPATPPKHLVAYSVVIDGDYILLVDHINAQLWLPTGGHIESGEHPRTAALREAMEELSIDGQFLVERPLFLTATETVGKTAGHTDVCIWYALQGDRTLDLDAATTEFRAARWFHKSEIPMDRADKHMRRFVGKLYTSTAAGFPSS